MASQIIRATLFFSFVSVLAGQNLLSCDTNSPDVFGYHCNDFDHCSTFAVFRTNSFFSSLSNLSLYLGLDRNVLSQANGFSTTTEFLPSGHSLLIPIDCRCTKGIFEALVTKITVKGDSFYGISESLEGLTTCKAIQGKNPNVKPWGVQEKLRLLLPLRCACPSQAEFKQGTNLLLSYPVKEGDAVSNLASEFNASVEDILFLNNRSGRSKSERLELFSTLLIPLTNKPILGLKPPDTLKHRKRKSKSKKTGFYILLCGVVPGTSVAALAVFLFYRSKKKKPDFCKSDDVELQHLSIRTRSEIKTISEASQDPFDTQTIDTTPHKMVVEIYTYDELKKATDNFHSTNLIEGVVFHGRLNGKNLAIKRIKTETVSKIGFELFQEAYHHCSSINRLIGTCLIDGPDSFLVFEYAKNGSLKDWIHSGLAMKSQFIASCYCFLTWNQRLKICLDVAMALEYMHHIMNPCYVHRNIKSRNIFLDEEFNAKIGNFGMARCTEDNLEADECLPLHTVSWNRGYLAPEYLQQGTITSSTDIFAYGVVLLELLSGQPPILRDDKGEGTILLSDKIKFILQSDDECEQLREWMDNALGEAYSFDMAVALAYLARSCVEEDPSCRPSAREMVEKLSKLVKEFGVGESLSRTSSVTLTPQAKVHVSVS